MKSESFNENDQGFGFQVLASTLAHELRNPLQSIRLQIDASERGHYHPDFLQNLKSDLSRLERVIQKLQSFSQPPQLQREELALGNLIDQSFASLGYWLTANQIRIHDDLGDIRDEILEVDGQLMEQVFLNLIMNSIQAMPNGGDIHLRARKNEDNLEIDLSDTGPGLSPDQLDKIGTPFFTTKSKGSGLGIAFCRSVIARHGGFLSHANSETGGCRVRLSMPLKTAGRKT
ncbi:MAG: hypothetical protein EA369_07185 [Bradymonadales bacterium]|nr:MAG: hypothetical protein EA369_07185 [Bradymonadales bacterium]